MVNSLKEYLKREEEVPQIKVTPKAKGTNSLSEYLNKGFKQSFDIATAPPKAILEGIKYIGSEFKKRKPELDTLAGKALPPDMDIPLPIRAALAPFAPSLAMPRETQAGIIAGITGGIIDPKERAKGPSPQPPSYLGAKLARPVGEGTAERFAGQVAGAVGAFQALPGSILTKLALRRTLREMSTGEPDPKRFTKGVITEDVPIAAAFGTAQIVSRAIGQNLGAQVTTAKALQYLEKTAGIKITPKIAGNVFKAIQRVAQGVAAGGTAKLLGRPTEEALALAIAGAIQPTGARALKPKQVALPPAKGVAPTKPGLPALLQPKPVAKPPPVVVPTTDPLIQEAKKYKSAEEFVGKKPVLMHSTSKQAKQAILSEGFSLKKFGETSKEWGKVYKKDPIGVSFTETDKAIPEEQITWKGEGKSSVVYSVPQFKNPLIIQDYIGDKGWKDSLHEQYKTGNSGRRLTTKLLNKGYDSIITMGSDKTPREVIALKPEAIKNFNTFDEAKSQLTDIWNKAQEGKPTNKLAEFMKKPEQAVPVEGQKPIAPSDVIAPPVIPGNPANLADFVKQPKTKTTILQYFIPAEYHLKELGFDATIGQPVREALQDFSIELMEKNDLLIKLQKEHLGQIPKNQHKQSLAKLWEYMDKGIPEGSKSVEATTAKKLRAETQEMLTRINKLNKRIGREEVRGVKNYILHMLKPEILNEIYSKGVIPPELAKVMQYIPPKNVFLRTAIERKGVPEDWLVKDPFLLMKTMYAIDLRYIHLQDALERVNPYLKAVKDYKGEGEDYWKPETYEYLDSWIKQAIKMRPSHFDTLIDNLLEYTIAPVLRNTGLKVSHMPWRDFISTLSAAIHTGALGMRVKPVLRNLVQSTFDWVMYGTQPYLKGSAKFLTKEGFKVLGKSKLWRTRMPFEAQDLSTLNRVFKIGGLGYRASDLHNVGKGLLTRYYYAIDTLKMTPDAALRWADNDLPATQWSYRREDLPRAYWTTTGRAVWTLGSWWMNFYTRFLPELVRRAYYGKDINGRIVPTAERLGIMRFFMLVGTLFAVKKASKELTGTVVDYTGQVTPTPLRGSPIAQMGGSMVDIGQGLTDKNERKLKEGIRKLGNTVKIAIPWYLAGQDLFNLLSGKKTIPETLFYGRQTKKKKVKAVF